MSFHRQEKCPPFQESVVQEPVPWLFSTFASPPPPLPDPPPLKDRPWYLLGHEVTPYLLMRKGLKSLLVWCLCLALAKLPSAWQFPLSFVRSSVIVSPSSLLRFEICLPVRCFRWMCPIRPSACPESDRNFYGCLSIRLRLSAPGSTFGLMLPCRDGRLMMIDDGDDPQSRVASNIPPPLRRKEKGVEGGETFVDAPPRPPPREEGGTRIKC